MKDFDRIVIDKFTLNYQKRGEKYDIWYTDFTFARGIYEYWVGNPKNDKSLHFKSSSFPAYATDSNYTWTFFLPGNSTREDGTKVTVSKEIIQNLIDCLNNPPKEATSLDDKVDNMCKNQLDGRHLGYYVVNVNKPTWATCKESLTTYLGDNYGYQPWCYMCEKFTKENVNWLHEIQEKIEPENRFVITKLKNCIKVEFPNWWKTQYCYRIGWMLLAIRVSNGRYVLTDTEKPFFDAFKEGKFSIDPLNYREWTGAKNWIFWLKTDSTKLA